MAYTTIDKPWTYFRTKTYTGNAGSQSITFDETDVNMQPDWTWIKKRNGAADSSVMDSVRGVRQSLTTNNNEDDYTESAGLSAWNSNGFSFDGSGFDHVNTSNTFVAWNWLAGGTAPSQTYTVTVVDDSGNKYRFDGFGTSAVTLDLQEGGTYTFDASDSSVSSHPFVIGTSANSNEYSTGVTYQLDGVTKTYSEYTSGFSSASSRKLIITVAASAPTLYYWCSVHSGMGGQINTNTLHGSSNFAGSVQTRVSASTTAGFSIVKYPGNNNGTTTTIGHGLGGVPELYIVKSLDSAGNWQSYHHKLASDPETDYIQLDENGARADYTFWGDTAPTSTVFTVKDGNDVNESGENFIAYCFRGIKGYSKYGSYTGNDGNNFIYTGFKPAFLICKRADSSDNWKILDNKRGATDPEGNPKNYTLMSDLANTEGAPEGGIDVYFHSNGFFFDGMTNDAYNHSGGEYIYIAIAEQPLVGSNDIPATAK